MKYKTIYSEYRLFCHFCAYNKLSLEMKIETRFSFPTEGAFRINIDMCTFGLFAQSQKTL